VETISAAVSPADFVRLLIIPVFVLLSWVDIKTRRIPNKVWPPIIAISILLITVDIYYYANSPLYTFNDYGINAALTLIITIPLAILLWVIGGWGGADAKALITFAFVFPTFPTFILTGAALPLWTPPHGVFPLTVLLNSVIAVPLYVTYLASKNAANGNGINRWALIGNTIPTKALNDHHGKLLEDTNGMTRNGVDIDSLKNYAEWSNIQLNDLSDHTDQQNKLDDPWQAEEFCNEHNNVYTPSKEELRRALNRVAEGGTIWITPGLPFFPLLTVGLILTVIIGSPIATLYV